jgi:hypothetical protein
MDGFPYGQLAFAEISRQAKSVSATRNQVARVKAIFT